MGTSSVRPAVCGVCLATCVGLAQAAPHQSLKGYEVVCPAGWHLSGRDDPELMERIDRGELPGLSNVDFSTIDVVMLDPASDRGVGLTVGFRLDADPFDAAARQRWTRNIRNAAAKSKMKLLLQKVGDIEVDGVEALSFETRWKYPLGMVQQWQVLVSSGTHLLLFTFFSPPEVFDSYRPVFEDTLTSVRLANGRRFWPWVGSIALAAVVGAAIGASTSAGVGWAINRSRARRSGKPVAETGNGNDE